MVENQPIDLDDLKRKMRLYQAEERVRPLLETPIPDPGNL